MKEIYCIEVVFESSEKTVLFKEFDHRPTDDEIKDFVEGKGFGRDESRQYCKLDHYPVRERLDGALPQCAICDCDMAIKAEEAWVTVKRHVRETLDTIHSARICSLCWSRFLEEAPWLSCEFSYEDESVE